MCRTCGCGDPGNSHGRREMPPPGKSKPAPVKKGTPVRKGGRKR